MIEVVCLCKWRFAVQDEHAGLSIKCPRCRRLVDVPATPPPSIVETSAEDADQAVSKASTGGFVALPSPDLAALRASIDQMLAVNRSINTRLAWIVTLLVLLLIRILLRG